MMLPPEMNVEQRRRIWLRAITQRREDSCQNVQPGNRGRQTARGLAPGREIHIHGKRGDRGRGQVIRVFDAERGRGLWVEYRERYSGCARFAPVWKVQAC